MRTAVPTERTARPRLQALFQPLHLLVGEHVIELVARRVHDGGDLMPPLLPDLVETFGGATQDGTYGCFLVSIVWLDHVVHEAGEATLRTERGDTLHAFLGEACIQQRAQHHSDEQGAQEQECRLGACVHGHSDERKVEEQWAGVIEGCLTVRAAPDVHAAIGAPQCVSVRPRQEYYRTP